MARNPLGDWVQLRRREIDLKLTISLLLPAAFMLLIACGWNAKAREEMGDTTCGQWRYTI